ncbi:MAG: hypothetical protein OXC42_05465 [Gammaproteobacteria bacterium]|nr:hypothetical protein [Gammaproteobacteria bacterium]
MACASPDRVLDQRLARYRMTAKGAFSTNTERAVRSDVEDYMDWFEVRMLVALPAKTDTVVGLRT